MVEKLVVCVADDCVDENTSLCEWLRLHGYETVSAYSGRETLSLCRTGKADLVLLDVGMPDLDGYEVCRQLKASVETRDIVVIFVTARDEQADVRRGYDLGAADYITKPYNPPIVMLRVDSALRTREIVGLPESGWLGDSVYTDPLTGLRNRRFLAERLSEELEKAHRHQTPVSCLFLDISEVEPVDRDLGSASMDDLLAEVALALRNSSRIYDVLARFDGCVFAAILPQTCKDSAIQYALKLQEEITTTTFSEPSFPTRAKLSFGIVTCYNGKPGGPEDIMGVAMQNLLHASAGCEEGIVAREF